MTRNVKKAKKSEETGTSDNLPPIKRVSSQAQGYAQLVGDIGALLETARRTAARAMNAVLCSTYWEVGRRIVEFEQAGKIRAEYGEELLKRLSYDLTARLGRGFSERNLDQMRLFYLGWPISQTVSAKSYPKGMRVDFPLPWSAYVRLLAVKNEHARKFYEAEALKGGWWKNSFGEKVRVQWQVLL